MSDYALRYVEANPSGNKTLLVLDAVPREMYAAIASGIISSHSVEQVGFVTAPQNAEASGRVEMMGGEFCGNASRCLAAWLAMGDGHGDLVPLKQQCVEVPIEITGYNGILSATVEKIEKANGCRVTIAMPLPVRIKHGQSIELGSYSLVAFEGITHVILWEREPDKKLAPYASRLASMYYGGCYGLLFTDIENGSMTPLVYVEETNSLIFEGSCGSGTVAVACAIAEKTRNKITHIDLSQPGGSLGADAVLKRTSITRAALSGDIFFTSAGKLFLDV